MKIHGNHGARVSGENFGKNVCVFEHTNTHTYTHTVDRQTAASIMGKLMEMIHG